MAAERFKTRLISTLAYWVIRMIGCTLRWETHGLEPFRAMFTDDRPMVAVFWHGRILASSYYFRNLGFVVLTSRHRDGEYITSIIRHLGFDSARGSSTRGSKGAMVEMLRSLRAGRKVAVTADGPRGPRYVAKPGAAWLAAKSGTPLFPFNISAEKKWILGSWDQCQIPKPFSRMVLFMGAPIHVVRDAGDEELAAAHNELQRALEDLLERGDSYWNSKKEQAGLSDHA